MLMVRSAPAVRFLYTCRATEKTILPLRQLMRKVPRRTALLFDRGLSNKYFSDYKKRQ